jgi:hypothetical protein
MKRQVFFIIFSSIILILTKQVDCQNSIHEGSIENDSLNQKENYPIGKSFESDVDEILNNSVLKAIDFIDGILDTIIQPHEDYEYSFETPPIGWQLTYGNWLTSQAPFGNVGGGTPGEFNYNTYWPVLTNLYLRKQIDLTDYNLETLQWYIGVDNGYTLYVNGQLISSNYAEGYTYRWEYSGTIDPLYLNPGINTVAIECVDNGGLTAFDMMITGQLEGDLNQGLVAYYPFNGNTNDESGNDYNGTVYGAIHTSDRFGNPNSAYAFDGINDYIQVAHDDIFNFSNTFSICTWVKHNTGYPLTFENMIMKGAWQYGLQFESGSFMFQTYSGGYQPLNSQFSPNALEWYFVTAVYNGSEKKIYINGILKNSISYTQILNNTTNPLTFGKPEASDNYFLNGALDDIRIYSRELSYSEIIKLYNQMDWGNLAILGGLIKEDQTGNPIEGATIQILPLTNGGFSNSNSTGNWQIHIPSGNGYELEIIKEGYETLHLTDLNFAGGMNYNFNNNMVKISNYLDYRIVPVALAPNPLILEIPEGGTGYAWFVLEGEYAQDNWLPLPAAEIEIVDGQGNQIYDKNGDPVKTNFLVYKFLTAAYHMQNAGVFGVPINASIIMDGGVGSMETIKVIGANGQALSIENQQAVVAKVIPYEYTQSWGFRVYAKGGLGAGSTTITKGNVFAGGGSGATILLELEGIGNNPVWSDFQVHRKDDLFVGAEISIGPPTLIETGFGAGTELTASFPYQTEYKFNMDDLEGLEAAMAFYIFYEPGILYAGTVFPPCQVGVLFLSGIVEAIIANSGQNGLGIVRVADESGLDIEGTIECSANLGIGVTKSLGLGLGPSVGAEAHLGGSIKKTVNEEEFRRLYLGGELDVNVQAGILLPGKTEIGSKFIYPYRLRQSNIPSSLGVEFQGISKRQYDQWQNLRLEASLESNSNWLNIYNLPGDRQKYTSWFEFDNEDVKNLFLNYAEHTSEVFNIGVTGVSTLFNDNTFKDDIVDFLDAIYQEQNDDLPVTLKYGIDACDKNESDIEMTVQFPLPIFPALDIVIGGGFESTRERNYKLSEGYWVKGLPYLQTEMPNPPQPQETFESVMTELWSNVTSGNVWEEIKNVIIAQISNSKFFKWLFGKETTQIVLLTPQGSSIKIKESSIPTTLDSVLCRQWEWGEIPATKSLNVNQEKKYKEYVKGLRDLRESVTGLHYGIGGFFRFEPVLHQFEDSTLLTIVYPDSAVIGYDESELHMFWEDTLGMWHPLESYVLSDSNKVSAWITHFATYTLAPKLPQGNYGLNSEPDSIPANGSSIALIYSDALLYNDSTIIEDGMMFTVETTRGTIITSDMDLETDGIQVELTDGNIQFEVQSDSIPTPIVVTAKSVEGFAVCQAQLTLFDTVHPNIPTNLMVIADNKGIHLTWNGVNDPDLAGYKIYFDTDTNIPPYNGIATVWGEPSPVNVGVTTEHLITGMLNEITYFIAVTAIDIAGNESDYSVPVSCTPNFGRTIDLKVFLEGPFNGTDMNTTLNSQGQLPTTQPYNTDPWFYDGEEVVAGIPNSDIVDWVLLELRETPFNADSAISTNMIDKRAVFLLKNGTLVGIDGNEAPKLYFSITHNLYAVIWHRNHLGIMSSNNIPLAEGDYSFDFTIGSAQVYGGDQGYKELAPNVWGMVAGDIDPNGIININDKENGWKNQAGQSGYKKSDINLNGQIDNVDKDDKLLPNIGKESQVPQ